MTEASASDWHVKTKLWTVSTTLDICVYKEVPRTSRNNSQDWLRRQ